MAGVLNGFAVIVVLVALGWILARTGVLGHDARLVLNDYGLECAADWCGARRSRAGRAGGCGPR